MTSAILEINNPHSLNHPTQAYTDVHMPDLRVGPNHIKHKWKLPKYLRRSLIVTSLLRFVPQRFSLIEQNKSI